MTQRLSEEQFTRLARRHNLTDQSLRRARQVLVEGEEPKEVAAREGVHPEAVRKVVRMIARHRDDRRLSQQQFERALRQTPQMTERNRQLAWRVLVNGEKPDDVANDAGLSPITVYQTVRRVHQNAAPQGWRTVTVTLPDNLADQVEAMEQEALEGHDKES